MDNTITKCDLCKGVVRVRITLTKPLIIENYGIVTTQFGGKFCSSGCALKFILKTKKKKKAIIKIS